MELIFLFFLCSFRSSVQPAIGQRIDNELAPDGRMPMSCRVTVDAATMQDRLDALNQLDKRFCDGLTEQFLNRTINFPPDVSKDYMQYTAERSFVAFLLNFHLSARFPPQYYLGSF